MPDEAQAMARRALWPLIVLAFAGCGGDPKTATGDELPLVDGAEVVQTLEEPNGILDATVLFQVITKSGVDGAELLDEERAHVVEEGWSVHRDDHEAAAWVADREGVDDFIRFGRPDAMRRAAMGLGARNEITDDRATLARSVVVQISPPGPPQPEP